MLTQNEKEWLKNRTIDLKSPGAYSCGHCEVQCFTLEKPCPLIVTSQAWKDAAEFEARVATKLAWLFSASTEIAPVCPGCPCEDDCYSGHLKCEAAMLKYARLLVEEEMDAD